ncbi:hypothetical protein [Algoriphagus marinus]|uniref:hypothetical protein n=1 Tax=Algoriphagus marinus TaxID=1925762 RepID=UPI000AAD04D6|nr:hypothetical protein [Algoriphagus marinus]
MTIGILGMTLFNIVLAPTANAQSTVGCEYLGKDEWNCHNYFCPSGCVVFVCPNSNPNLPYPETDQTCP